MNNFFPLHIHSHYSLRDSINTIPQIIDAVKKFGYPGFTLTEHGNMSSVVKAYVKAKEAGLKFIPGCEFYIAPRHRSDHEPKDRAYYHLCLYAMDLPAYKALSFLISESNKPENHYYKPRIDHELLAEYGRKFNIICTSGCLASELTRSVLKYDRFDYDGREKDELVPTDYKEVVDFYRGVFGDRYYIELHNHGIPAELRYAELILDYAKKTKIKTIFATDAHYISPEDQYIHNVMLAIKQNQPVEECGYPGNNHCFLPIEELKKLSYDQKSLDNTVEIGERCNVTLALDKLYMPKLHKTLSEEHDIIYNACVTRLCNLFQCDFHEIPEDYKKRFDLEFDMITDMGFSGYFLIVKDFIQWAMKNDIAVGPGRGSVGGSLVAYLLGITKIDPMKYPLLLFERFLNESRAPKLDLKFEAI